MANEIYLNEFLTKEELFENCSESVLKEIQNSVLEKNTCNVLLSGGSTPEPLYKLFAKNKDLVTQVQWGLVDERFIETTSDYSNEKMIRNALGNQATVFGMVSDSTNYQANLIKINKIGIPHRESFSIPFEIPPDRIQKFNKNVIKKKT